MEVVVLQQQVLLYLVFVVPTTQVLSSFFYIFCSFRTRLEFLLCLNSVGAYFMLSRYQNYFFYIFSFSAVILLLKLNVRVFSFFKYWSCSKCILNSKFLNKFWNQRDFLQFSYAHAIFIIDIVFQVFYLYSAFCFLLPVLKKNFFFFFSNIFHQLQVFSKNFGGIGGFVVVNLWGSCIVASRKVDTQALILFKTHNFSTLLFFSRVIFDFLQQLQIEYLMRPYQMCDTNLLILGPQIRLQQQQQQQQYEKQQQYSRVAADGRVRLKLQFLNLTISKAIQNLQLFIKYNKFSVKIFTTKRCSRVDNPYAFFSWVQQSLVILHKRGGQNLCVIRS
eukprot:TRINITY_DN17752_c0_g2_i1.p1 TRINITY_DN17752_c0_g2~~TRINITY_DN17752_c0_g2_i1.p1  ORF type:complete len:333 (+),score=-4.58 TRINITY_DN17752_c0_g2_i1:188-1186(+)